jgi:large subunit ribosomal protein L9
MKVLLLKFVKDLGREGDIIDVSDGYAVNALFPRGLAKQATASVINKHKMAQKSAAIKAEKEKNLVISNLKKIDGKTLVFEEKLNAKGSLYHALGLKEIIKAIKEQYNVSIPNNLFKEKYSFKEAGKYTIELSAYNVEIKAIVFIEGK